MEIETRKNGDWQSDGDGDREREEGWTSGPQRWNERLIWNESEAPVQVKVTNYITASDDSSHILLNHHDCSLEKRREQERRRDLQQQVESKCRGGKGGGWGALQTDKSSLYFVHSCLLKSTNKMKAHTK